jgi:hypothetical protein
MIDLLFTFGAVAESKTPPPNRRFDDSQDCRTFLKGQLVGFGRLRISQRCQEGSAQPGPWRSL